MMNEDDTDAQHKESILKSVENKCGLLDGSFVESALSSSEIDEAIADESRFIGGANFCAFLDDEDGLDSLVS